MTENDPVTAGELCPPGYKLKYLSSRKDRRGGGDSNSYSITAIYHCKSQPKC